MALGTVYGANYTKAFNSNPPVMVAQGESGAKVKCLQDSYTLPSAVIDVGDVVKLGALKLPKGAKVVDAIIACASLGDTGILKLGIIDNGIDFRNASGTLLKTASELQAIFISSADAGGQAVMQHPNAGCDGIFKALGAETQVVLGCSKISTNNNVKIDVAVFYVLD